MLIALPIIAHLVLTITLSHRYYIWNIGELGVRLKKLPRVAELGQLARHLRRGDVSVPRQPKADISLQRQSGRRNSFFLGGGSDILFYSGLRLIEMGPLTLGRTICFIQSTDVNVNLIQNTLPNTVWPKIWASHTAPPPRNQVTHEINHHSLSDSNCCALCCHFKIHLTVFLRWTFSLLSHKPYWNESC